MVSKLFLGRFRIFENRPLDPVFYLLSKCEKQIIEKSKKLKNWSKPQMLSLAQLGSALGSILALKFKRSPFCSNPFEFLFDFSLFSYRIP